MSARRLRLAIAVTAALALTLGAAACSREDAIDDASSTSTALDGTTIPASDTTVPSSDTTAPPTDSTDTTDSSSTTEETTDVFGNTDAQNASYRAAYRAAFEGECRRIWATYAGADGVMSDPDFPEDPYFVDDCLYELDDSWGEFASSVEEAQASGTDDAQIAASDLADPLCDSSGTRCYSYGD